MGTLTLDHNKCSYRTQVAWLFYFLFDFKENNYQFFEKMPIHYFFERRRNSHTLTVNLFEKRSFLKKCKNLGCHQKKFFVPVSFFFFSALFWKGGEKWRCSEAVVQRCSVRKDVLRNFAKFTAKHLCQSLFFIKVAGLLRWLLLGV